MDDEAFNMSVRKFLKKLGITAQKQVERAVRETGTSAGKVKITATIEADAIGLRHVVDGEIDLGE